MDIFMILVAWTGYGARLCVHSTPAAACRMKVGRRVQELVVQYSVLRLVSDTAALLA